MQFIYRGVSYDNTLPVEETKTRDKLGTYRGQKWRKSQSNSVFCRACRYYQPEGRRGGLCELLNVNVEGGWEACALAIPPFVDKD
jgi:hypothetical protein